MSPKRKEKRERERTMLLINISLSPEGLTPCGLTAMFLLSGDGQRGRVGEGREAQYV